ncbi:class I SAM-dependent methyltransferase [Endozoicomonas ascidiicola]|uniref:class I SAM-dependent methyltransferase n=1 Tax=Endozoicomonas ascidiicola TaxID=1698521 RepID=UPI00082B03B3|nr:class I SAM-dependent methyltransferase [Endozoicomonas ascidiicola]
MITPIGNFNKPASNADQTAAPSTDTENPIKGSAPQIIWNPANYVENSTSQTEDSHALTSELLKRNIIKAPVSRVLDIGCGPGNNLAEYKKLFGGQVVGIDPSEDMYKAAKERFQASEDIEILCAGADNFSYSEEFPLALSIHALHWISNKKMPNALKNIGQHLAPEGIFSAFFAASKAGLPFHTSLEKTKALPEFQDHFTEYKPSQFFYSVSEMECLILGACRT